MTQAILTPSWFLQQITYMGAPVNGGTLDFFVGGTTNLRKNVYYDTDRTVPAPNPLPLDASGTAPQYYLETGYYHIFVKDRNGIPLYDRDYVSGGGDGSTVEDTYKVKSTSADTVPDFLAEKIIGAGGIQIGTVPLPTGVKTTVTFDGRIPTNSTDATIEYLDQKIINSPSITWETTGSVTKKLRAKLNDTYGTVIPSWTILKNTDPATPSFGLSTTDLEQIWLHHYGVAGTLTQSTGAALSIWYLEGGTYYGDATWIEKKYLDGQLILNANHGLYDYLHVNPEFPQTDDLYSNYPAGLYVMTRDGDNHLWTELVVNTYPDPSYSTSAVLTYNGTTKQFEWTANENLPSEGTVKIDINDSNGFLGYKVQAGAGITVVDTPNGAYGRFLKINATGTNPSGGGYCPTMDYASATDTIMPQLIGSQTELLVLFVPRTDFTVTASSLLGVSMLQGASGVLSINIRDASSQYNLIVNGGQITNPTSNTFLESGINDIRDPITHASISTYTLKAGVRYYFSLHYSLNGVTYLGRVASQTTNIAPLPAIRFDNLSYITDTLSGSGTESLARPFIRIRNIGA